MSGQMVRIEENAHQTLRELSESTGESMQTIAGKAIEEYRRKLFLESANEAYVRLRKNPSRWKQEQEERREWDNTQLDGMEE